ncbi:MAG TPA: hypothetical protein VJL31_19725, partial [Gemmatimonadales bacterium]|nr:hypothetical protein [Gemmatimonadales bacterium]
MFRKTGVAVSAVALVALGCESAPLAPEGDVAPVLAARSPMPKGIITFHGWDTNYEIYTIGADGTGLTRLTSVAADDVLPAVSPDGKRIAFESYRDGNAEIYVMNADGTGLTNLTQHPAGDGRPNWSADGKMIAFESGRDGLEAVFVMAADGTAVTNVTGGTGLYSA